MSETRGKFVTPGQAAEILHVSPKTVSRWCTQGKFAGLLVTEGGHRKIPASEVEAAAQRMAARGQSQAAPATPTSQPKQSKQPASPPKRLKPRRS